MKRWAALLVFLGLLCGSAHAACSGGVLPFNLTNGTLADASQVMANYNAIISAINATCAGQGTNSDITSLTGLTTPLSISQGGGRVYTGVTQATGTVNAQVVAASNPIGFTLTSGNIACWLPAGTNTSNVTLAFAGTTAAPVQKQVIPGLTPLVGGELNSNSIACAFYDGTNYELITNTGQGVPAGTVLDHAGTVAPAGYLLCDGASYSTTGVTAALFSVIGYTYGGSGANFNVPDMRGRVGAGNDAVANRLNNGNIGSIAGNATQSLTIGVANLPAHTHSGTTASENATHTHTYNAPTQQGFQSGTSGGNMMSTTTATATTTESANHQHTFTTDNGTGGHAAVNIAQPTVILNKIIKMKFLVRPPREDFAVAI
jgi:microcystin-dependent protein